MDDYREFGQRAKHGRAPLPYAKIGNAANPYLIVLRGSPLVRLSTSRQILTGDGCTGEILVSLRDSAWVHPDSPIGNLTRAGNAGFIGKKMAFDTSCRINPAFHSA